MRILIATGLYPPEIGGPATYTTFLEKHLERFGIGCSVLPYSVVRKLPRIIRHITYIWKLIRMSRDVDMLYALDTVSVGLPVYIASRVMRMKYLLRIPGDYAWEQGQQRFGITETLDEFVMRRPKSLQVRVLAWIQRLVAYHAYHVIVPSDYMKTMVKGWGVPEKKITRIYSALKVIQVDKTKRELRTQFKYQDFVVVTACRLVPWKGVSTLIDVIKSIHDRGVKISLDILGDGVSRNELEKKVIELKMQSYVTFRGNLDRSEMGERVNAADVFVLNTSYEGLSHQLIEVMSLGTPIVTTPVGGNTELITDKKTGLFVSYNNVNQIEAGILSILEDQNSAATRAREARFVVQNFDENRVIEEFVRLVKTLN